jgi:hypothetical protein
MATFLDDLLADTAHGENEATESKTYWMMMLLAPLTIRRPLPLITPLDP